jgi:hypothetical protein
MKRGFLIVSLLLTFSFADAQKRFSTDLNVGIASAHFRGASSEIKATSDSKIGLAVGLGTQWKFNHLLSLQAELNYQNLGGGADNTLVVPLSGYKRYDFQYIYLPLLLKIKIPKTGFGVYAGPQFGYLVKSTFKDPGVATRQSRYFNKTDLSAVAGAECAFDLKGGNQIVFSGRYQFSTICIIKNSTPDSYLKNGAFVATLGYRFAW